MEIIAAYGDGGWRVLHAGVEYRYTTERRARKAARAFQRADGSVIARVIP